jgi:lauroyl/myristoyl acyltransferase
MAYWLYLLAILLVPLLPERFGYWLFARLGDLAYLFGAGARAAYLKNLQHVLGPPADPAARRGLARRAFQNLMKNYFDLFRGHRLTDAQLRAQLAELVGFEHMEAALAQGKGLVAGSAHFGNFNLFLHLAAVYLKEHRDIVVPIERLKPERMYELVKQQRAAQGVEIVPVDTAARVLIKTLRAGNIVGLALDLDVTRTGPVVNFFGAPAQLPDGAAALALKYQTPLIIGFPRRLPNNRTAVIIEPPLQFETTGDLARDTRAGVEKIARCLERWISQYPDQWVMFQPIWEEDR